MHGFTPELSAILRRYAEHMRAHKEKPKYSTVMEIIDSKRKDMTTFDREDYILKLSQNDGEVQKYYSRHMKNFDDKPKRTIAKAKMLQMLEIDNKTKNLTTEQRNHFLNNATNEEVYRLTSKKTKKLHSRRKSSKLPTCAVGSFLKRQKQKQYSENEGDLGRR